MDPSNLLGHCHAEAKVCKLHRTRMREHSGRARELVGPRVRACVLSRCHAHAHAPLCACMRTWSSCSATRPSRSSRTALGRPLCSPMALREKNVRIEEDKGSGGQYIYIYIYICIYIYIYIYNPEKGIGEGGQKGREGCPGREGGKEGGRFQAALYYVCIAQTHLQRRIGQTAHSSPART